MNLRDPVPGLAALSESLLGFSAKRCLPKWRSDTFHLFPRSWRGIVTPIPALPIEAEGAISREVVLLVDTFNNYFEPENARAALAVLRAAGYQVHLPRAQDSARPLCCGRTFLAAGLVDEAEAEARRMIATLKPFVDRGVPVIGLEPSCLLVLARRIHLDAAGRRQPPNSR